MRFANPYLLFLLFLLPLLLWWRGRQSRTQSLPFSNGEALTRLPKSWRIYLQPLMPTLYILGLCCLIVALARPQRGLSESQIHTEAVDMILLLDLSESMDTPDFAKNMRRISRLDATKDVVERFLEKRPNDRIGVVGFASLPYAVAPLTLDHPWLNERIQGLHTDMLDGRSTAIGDGIASAVNRLRDSEAKSKLIILLTDGANNAGTLSPINAAQAAAALGIKIYTIGAGGEARGFFQRGGEVDEGTLQKIADTTKGIFYRAKNLETLDEVYAEIDKLEKTEIEMNRYTRYQEHAGNWVIAALLLLAAEQFLRLTKLERLG